MAYAALDFIRSSGLGNRLFPWARAQLHCLSTGDILIAPRWHAIRRGPILRGGRVCGGVPVRCIPGKIWLIGNFRADRHPQVERAPLESAALTWFAGDGQFFADLAGCHEVLLTELERIVTMRVHRQVAQHLASPIVLNVRLGRDFPAPLSPDQIPTGPSRSPLSWYVETLRTVRKELGEDCPAIIVSDGTPGELAPLLREPRVALARTTLAAADLLLLARARCLIVTGGSSFSAWGAFLSQADVISKAGYPMEWFNLHLASSGKMRTMADHPASV